MGFRKCLYQNVMGKHFIVGNKRWHFHAHSHATSRAKNVLVTKLRKLSNSNHNCLGNDVQLCVRFWKWQLLLIKTYMWRDCSFNWLSQFNTISESMLALQWMECEHELLNRMLLWLKYYHTNQTKTGLDKISLATETRTWISLWCVLNRK